jgi:tryptophanyl-tRNA synthetase
MVNMSIRRLNQNGVYRLFCRTMSDTVNSPQDNPGSFTVFSGIQPTGRIHLGNYLGAVTLWRNLVQRSQHSCVFSLVDLHSITVKQEPEHLNRQIYEQLATLIASGIDPNKCILFRQSDVPEHGQLAWVLACQLTMTKLNAIPQFKVRMPFNHTP